MGDPVVAEDDDGDVLTYTLVDPRLDKFVMTAQTHSIIDVGHGPVHDQGTSWNTETVGNGHLRRHGQGHRPGRCTPSPDS